MFCLHSCFPLSFPPALWALHGPLLLPKSSSLPGPLSPVVSQHPELSLPSACGHGMCQKHSGSLGEGDSTDTKFLFSIPTCIGFCLIYLLIAKCRKTQHEILTSLLQGTGKVSCNSEGIRNLLFCKYSKITCPECLHKLRYLLEADFISKSV